MRLLSGEKTPLCKNICCGNGCQTPFCGLLVFFAWKLSFVLIIYVGEGVTLNDCGIYSRLLAVLVASVCTSRRVYIIDKMEK